MITLQALLLFLSLHLPFPVDWINSVQVQVAPVTAPGGWLGYACEQGVFYREVDCPNTSAPTIMLAPFVAHGQGDLSLDLERNVVAHEAYHLYFGHTHARLGDPNDERGAYAFGCQAQWISLCEGWLR